MPAIERITQNGTKRGRRANTTLGEEFGQKRLAIGLSQAAVAAAAGISRSTYSRIESGRYEALSVIVASRVATALGLDLAVRAYPGGEPLRDAAQAKRLERVLITVASPLAYRTEVGLPNSGKNLYEQRAWDADVIGRGRRTTMEMEMRITDAQALERRINNKRRDDPADAFVLLVADTEHNRRVLREYPAAFPDLARITFGAFTRILKAGQHPPNSLVLV